MTDPESGRRALRVVIEADGGSRGNPGPAGYGAVVFDADSGEVLAERYDSIGIDTNNVAEYRGLIAGLQAAVELGATSVAVRMDSKLVIEQMSGRWQVKHPSMRPLAREAANLLATFPQTSFEWIPRERNKHADRLANKAMDAAAGHPPAAVKAARRADAPLPATSPPATSTVTPVTPVTPAVTLARRWTPPEGPPTRLILLRHGSTAHSPQRRYSGRNELPLSELGERQAKALAIRAKSFGDIDAVISSPLPRTMMTAEAVAAAVGRPVERCEGLIEADFGLWEGLTGEEVRQRWPNELAAWLGSPDVAPPNGESFAAVALRVARARDEIIAAHPAATVVLVSHVTPIKTLLTLALDAPPSSMFRIFLDTASISIIDHYADDAASVRLVNDTSHLADI